MSIVCQVRVSGWRDGGKRVVTQIRLDGPGLLCSQESIANLSGWKELRRCTD